MEKINWGPGLDVSCLLAEPRTQLRLYTDESKGTRYLHLIKPRA